MHPRPYQNRQHQRGFTLMEILVAVAIFVTVMIVALLLYDRSNRVFKTANESAEMQQNTRVAFEKVVADLRMAGFDYKRAGTPTNTAPAPWVADRTYSTGTVVTPTTPNGHVYRCINAGTSDPATEPAWTKGNGDIVLDLAPLKWQEGGAPVYEQPDEQIEYAHSAAVTLRANFDYDEPNTENGREKTLEDSTLGSFPVVTTGNDEIVTYALVSRGTGTGINADKIEYYADVNDGLPLKRESYPGGTIERLITIKGVDLTNSNPPYTLMRYTLNDKGEVVATALADNIRSMNFQYWEDSAATRALTDLDNNPVPNIGGAGPYDPDDPGALVKERLIRGKVRAVTVNIVGMNPQPDYDYTNPNETLAAAKNYRQYTLQSTVVGRNLGLEGVPESTSNPPGPPVMESVCNGFCGITVLSWKPDESTSGDVSYTIYYDKSSAGSFTGLLPAGSQTTYAVDLTQALPDATTYYFKVGATNQFGTTLSKNFVTVDVRNATKPNAPGSVAVSPTTKPNELLVKWAVPSGNASGVMSCTGTGTALDNYAAEIKGYRLYRSLNAGFNIGDAGVVELINENTGGATTDGSGTWSFTDKTVAACETYYYKVAAVEWCEAAAAYNTTGDSTTGMSDASAQADGKTIPVVKPRAPQNLKVDPSSGCDVAANKCYPIILTWDKVTKDVNNNDVTVVDYEIRRQRKKNGANDPSSPEAVYTISDGTTTFSESGSLEYADEFGVKYSYEYSVRAYFGYGDCHLGSDAAKISFPDSCSTQATVVSDSSSGTGTSGDPWHDVSGIQVLEGPKTLTSVEYSLDGGSFSAMTFPYLYAYDDLEDGAVHSVEFKITAAGCTETVTVYVQNDAPSCLLTGTVVNHPTTGTALNINMLSTSSETITITGIDITWDAQTGMAWNSITLPSGANHTATGSAAVARTVAFTPGASDKTIAPNNSYQIRMNLTGSAIAYGHKVSAVTVRYTVPSTGTAVHNCLLQITRCSVTAAASFLNSLAVAVKITNDSTEALDLQTFSIVWTNQNKLDWAKLELPSSATLGVSTATNGGTETFTAPISDNIITGTSSYTANMLFTSTFNNPPAVDETHVGAVWVNYRTPTSGTVTLSCRAK